jgi:cytochrome c-type biogenesis protein CcmE
MTRKQRRLTMIGGSLAVLAIAAALVLNAMRDSIVFFSTPTMAAEKQIPPGKRFRLGGLVQPGSLVRGDNLAVNFSVADGSATLPVAYKGILPDLFREGQGVVAEGALDASGVFGRYGAVKHDETYAPVSPMPEAGALEGRLRRPSPAPRPRRAGAEASK